MTGRIQRILMVIIALTLVGTSGVHAQDALTELYGNGVHAYFTGNLDEAAALFTQAIDNESDDPRVFYYRGVINLKQGKTDEAAADFAAGANAEADDIAGFYPVSKSLQRIQGAARLQIEKARKQAVVDREAVEKARLRQRYEAFESSEADVIRDTTPMPLVIARPMLTQEQLNNISASNPFKGENAEGIFGSAKPEDSTATNLAIIQFQAKPIKGETLAPPTAGDANTVAANNPAGGSGNATGSTPSNPFGNAPANTGGSTGSTKPWLGSWKTTQISLRDPMGQLQPLPSAQLSMTLTFTDTKATIAVTIMGQEQSQAADYTIKPGAENDFDELPGTYDYVGYTSEADGTRTHFGVQLKGNDTCTVTLVAMGKEQVLELERQGSAPAAATGATPPADTPPATNANPFGAPAAGGNKPAAPANPFGAPAAGGNNGGANKPAAPANPFGAPAAGGNKPAAPANPFAPKN